MDDSVFDIAIQTTTLSEFLESVTYTNSLLESTIEDRPLEYEEWIDEEIPFGVTIFNDLQAEDHIEEEEPIATVNHHIIVEYTEWHVPSPATILQRGNGIWNEVYEVPRCMSPRAIVHKPETISTTPVYDLTPLSIDAQQEEGQEEDNDEIELDFTIISEDELFGRDHSEAEDEELQIHVEEMESFEEPQEEIEVEVGNTLESQESTPVEQYHDSDRTVSIHSESDDTVVSAFRTYLPHITKELLIDYERHRKDFICGVKTIRRSECKRKLACPDHPLESRRQVLRSKPYDELVQEERQKIEYFRWTRKLHRRISNAKQDLIARGIIKQDKPRVTPSISSPVKNSSTDFKLDPEISGVYFNGVLENIEYICERPPVMVEAVDFYIPESNGTRAEVCFMDPNSPLAKRSNGCKNRQIY